MDEILHWEIGHEYPEWACSSMGGGRPCTIDLRYVTCPKCLEAARKKAEQMLKDIER